MTMFIDGVDIATLYGDKIEFLNYELPNPSLNRYITVTDNDRKKTNKRKSIGINNIVVKLVMYDTKENCYIMASKLASLLGDEPEVNFGGSLTYRVQIATDGSFSNLAYNTFEYDIQLQILEKMGELVTVTTTDDYVTLVNDGTYKTPIRIEVTSSSNLASMAMSGFGSHTISNPLTVTTITANHTIIVDGEICQILEDVSGVETNKFSSSNLADFPEIPVGETTILFTPAGTTKVITYRPRYV